MEQQGSPPQPVDHRSNQEDSVSWSAVGIGVAVDWIATLATTMLVVATASAIAESRSPGPESAEQYIAQLQASPDFMLTFTLLGLLCVSFGAFIAARRAGHSELRHGALVGVGSVVLALVMESLQAPGDNSAEVWSPTWLRVLGYALVIPFGMLGGAFAERIRPDDGAGIP
jgi:putative membrane protein (TIGR04086 family)